MRQIVSKSKSEGMTIDSLTLVKKVLMSYNLLQIIDKNQFVSYLSNYINKVWVMNGRRLNPISTLY